MTRITGIPFIKDANGILIAPGRVHSILTDSTGDDYGTGDTVNIDPYDLHPGIDLTPPAINSAWKITVKQGSRVITRTVVFTGERATWETLIDVDPATLIPVPTGAALAEWEAFLLRLDAAKGDKGDQGERGYPGVDGKDGINGAPGTNGRDGAKGDQGPQGIPGVPGQPGAVGAQGVKGDRGEVGPTGPTGAASTVPGPQGVQGVKGDQGAQGIQGATGDRGPVGPAGLVWRGVWSSTIDYTNNDSVFYNGGSWFAAGDPPVGDVPSDASAYWNQLAARGIQGVKGDQGIQGIQGTKGDQGIQGVKGDQGIQGIQGVKGDPGATGSTGATGATGPQGPSGSSAGKAARYTSSSALNASSQASTLVPIDTLQLNDDANYYVLSANKITVKVAGLYLVAYSGNVTCSSTYSLFVQKNTTTIQEGSGVSGQTFTAATLQRFAAGDTLSLRVYGNAAATVSAGALLSLVYLEGVKGDIGPVGPGINTYATTAALQATTGAFIGALAIAQDTGATWRWMGSTPTWQLWEYPAIPIATYASLLGTSESGRSIEANLHSGVLTVNYSVAMSGGISTGTSILQMKAGFRPAGTIHDTAHALASTSGVGLMEVNTSGYLYAWSYIATSGNVTSLRGTVSYRIAQ